MNLRAAFAFANVAGENSSHARGSRGAPSAIATPALMVVEAAGRPLVAFAHPATPPSPRRSTGTIPRVWPAVRIMAINARVAPPVRPKRRRSALFPVMARCSQS